MGGGKCERVPLTEEEREAMISEIAESARETIADYDYMTLSEIAGIIGVSCAQTVKYMLAKKGIEIKKRYINETGKMTNVVSIEDGKRFIEERLS